MSFFTALYNIIVGPLELVFEIIYSMAYRITENPGLSIIALSLVMNFLVLPLYKRADDMQAEQREVEKKLHKWETHIKKTFKGDEQYMMIQTYYRQNHYKPTYALRGMVSLLLEIPFFIAAYNMLSGLQLLHGVSFGPIRDLGAPDALLVIGGISINVLPILMTVINGITSAIYTKGYPLKSKIQLYGMALIFLVLLYTSPSGLVFYWTLNNLFSLVKTLFYQLKNPKKVLSILFSGVGAAALALVLFIHPMPTARSQIMMCLLLAIFQFPLILMLAGRRRISKVPAEATKTDITNFHLGCLFLAVLVGFMIPVGVLRASPEEFINRFTLTNPLRYLSFSVLTAVGIFLVWFEIFFKLANPAGKKWMSYGILAAAVAAVIDNLFFGTGLGTLSPDLRFVNQPIFAVREQVLNLLVLVAVAAALYWIWKKWGGLVKAGYFAMIVALAATSVLNVVQIQNTIPEKLEAMRSTDTEIRIPLSKKGKNVMVLMMDRAIGAYIPYIFNERPELQKQFAGFTYYPNTISYGPFTNFGSPAVFGGYEYIPEEMNKRDQERLEDKHNESLLVMPVTFDDQGYQVTVMDPTYAGYDWIPDLSIYDDYPNIKAYNPGNTISESSAEEEYFKEKALRRNLFCYSLLKVAPYAVQSNFYDDGFYNDLNRRFPAEERSAEQEQAIPTPQTAESIYRAAGVSDLFMKWYRELQNLRSFTCITNDERNTFLALSNELPHEPMLLQEPQYEPAAYVDNTAYDNEHPDRFILDGQELKMDTLEGVIHYQTNMSAMIQLGSWFDYLREQGVYDNTRIIIVADHGRDLGQIESMQFGEAGYEDVMLFNPLLMVKDFGSKTFTTDSQFMTNGDVPSLAFEGLIENPVNPFTGKPITMEHKLEPIQHVFYSDKWNTSENNGNTFLPGTWLELKNQNIFDADNWRRLP